MIQSVGLASLCYMLTAAVQRLCKLEQQRVIVDIWAGKFQKLRPTKDFSDMRKWLVKFFSKPDLNFSADRWMDAKLMSMLVLMTQSLLDFGYYASDDPKPTMAEPRSGTLVQV